MFNVLACKRPDTLFLAWGMDTGLTSLQKDDGRDFQVVRSLDPCSKGPGFKTTFRPVTKCEERISQLSVIPAKKKKESRAVVTSR